MSYMLTDRVTIKNITRDTTFGDETISTTITDVKCKIQNISMVVINIQGSVAKFTKPIMKFYFNKDININKGDYIQITKKHGKTLIDQDTKKIKEIKILGGFITKYMVAII